MQKRRRFNQTMTLKERLTAFAEEAREQAKLLRAGNERDELLRKARQADMAAHIDEWTNSPELQRPK
ncbi:MAG: hypothetical protein KGQ48_04585 [Bradyrhizobium sp.]|uniref:hypothetical protein n=1 Tax=Bradyrhizobium sp. TaxID=376 RepID=UPI001EBF09A0|nr:hypothetical protein [Bradyrhizobium sp.]MBU6456801.1 hypothetical protein [Bradyrhizobium sp.]MDE2602209.1 hypothetical protein [Bradyrhizobium sp.]